MPLLTKKNIEKITEVSVLNPLITLKKLECFKQVKKGSMNTLAWDNTKKFLTRPWFWELFFFVPLGAKKKSPFFCSPSFHWFLGCSICGERGGFWALKITKKF
jgi:hypothetical protein